MIFREEVAADIYAPLVLAPLYSGWVNDIVAVAALVAVVQVLYFGVRFVLSVVRR